jgi:hypothetical protein
MRFGLDLDMTRFGFGRGKIGRAQPSLSSAAPNHHGLTDSQFYHHPSRNGRRGFVNGPGVEGLSSISWPRDQRNPIQHFCGFGLRHNVLFNYRYLITARDTTHLDRNAILATAMQVRQAGSRRENRIQPETGWQKKQPA